MYENEIKRLVNNLLERKSISNTICEFYGNKDFEDELISIADNTIVSSFYNEVSLEDKALVSIAITLIASKDYDGGLWDYIREHFQRTYNLSNNTQHIDGKIRNILSVFKSYVNYSNSESCVAVPLVLTGVTHYWLKSFFDFCFFDL